MAETWKQWEGQVVDGLFPLRQLLRGGEHSAIFLTEYGAHEPQAAIKLVPVPHGAEESLLSQWALAERLSHPHLIRLLQSGRCRLYNSQCLYLVMELAEEDLSQVLADRSLTPGEAGDMLRALLDAVEYVHSKGLVHTHLRPANIMAARDELKLSADGICAPGQAGSGPIEASAYDPPELAAEGPSAPGDIWSLGVTLVQALTQRFPTWAAGELVLPAGMPDPYAQIARECLQQDPRRRCSLESIRERLESSVSVPPAPLASEATQSVSTRSGQAESASEIAWRYAILGGGAAVVLAALLIGYRLFYAQSRARSAESPLPTSPPSAVAAPTGRSNSLHDGQAPQVLAQVMPEVSVKAVNTIQGTVRVNVRIQVNPDGTVGAAKLTSSGPSTYFAGAALQAARGWRFAPGTASSDWILRFEFRRDGTKVFPSRLPVS